MKRKNLLLTSLLTVFTFFSFCFLEVKAQNSQFVPPVELYRFRVSNNTLGYFLTPYYSEGVNLGFAYDGVVGSIYVPSLTFVPSSNILKPIYYYRVNQGNRIYYVYTVATAAQGSPGYLYLGIRGYMYDQAFNQITTQSPVGQITFTPYKLKSCYSQSLGFWYGRLTPIGSNGVYSLENPPASYNCGAEHQIVGGFALTPFGTGPDAQQPISENFNWENYGSRRNDNAEEAPMELFNAPPPPPECDPDQENACYYNGGSWNSTNCSCEYFEE